MLSLRLIHSCREVRLTDFPAFLLLICNPPYCKLNLSFLSSTIDFYFNNNKEILIFSNSLLFLNYIYKLFLDIS